MTTPDLESEWDDALRREDSVRVQELLEKNPHLLGVTWKGDLLQKVEELRTNYFQRASGRPPAATEANSTTFNERTALHVGARRGNLKLVELILRRCKVEAVVLKYQKLEARTRTPSTSDRSTDSDSQRFHQENVGENADPEASQELASAETGVPSPGDAVFEGDVPGHQEIVEEKVDPEASQEPASAGTGLPSPGDGVFEGDVPGHQEIVEEKVDPEASHILHETGVRSPDDDVSESDIPGSQPSASADSGPSAQTRSSASTKENKMVKMRRAIACINLISRFERGPAERRARDLSTFLLEALDCVYKLDVMSIAVVQGNFDVLLALSHAAAQYELYDTVADRRMFPLRELPPLDVRDGDSMTENLVHLRRFNEIVVDMVTIPDGRLVEDYQKHLDFNFLPWQEYMFHFLLTSEVGARGFNYKPDLPGQLDSFSIGQRRYMLDLQDAQGRTPLHVAVDEDTISLFERLLRFIVEGRQAPSRSKRGVARGGSMRSLIAWAMTAADGAGRTALHRATTLGKENAVEQLKMLMGEDNKCLQHVMFPDYQCSLDLHARPRARPHPLSRFPTTNISAKNGFSGSLWLASPVHSAIVHKHNNILASFGFSDAGDNSRPTKNQHFWSWVYRWAAWETITPHREERHSRPVSRAVDTVPEEEVLAEERRENRRLREARLEEQPPGQAKLVAETLRHVTRAGHVWLVEQIFQGKYYKEDMYAVVNQWKEGLLPHIAAKAGKFAMLKLLVDNPHIDLYAQDVQGETALHQALSGPAYRVPVTHLLDYVSCQHLLSNDPRQEYNGMYKSDARKRNEKAALKKKVEAARKKKDDAAQTKKDESARKGKADTTRKEKADTARKEKAETARKGTAEAARKEKAEAARTKKERAARTEKDEADSARMSDKADLAERQECINLLVKAGCEVFKLDNQNQSPHPKCELSKDKDFCIWWFQTQFEFFKANQKTMVSVGNAISVTATLVATASYVGPLQPPVGYAGDPNQIQDQIIWVRIFIFCDTMSFYIAVCAIILSLIPNLPSPQQNMADESRFTRQMVGLAIGFLFPSIVFVLIAFASSSIAVISADPSSTGGTLTILTASVGGFLCSCTFLLFSLRVLAFAFPTKKSIKQLSKLNTWIDISKAVVGWIAFVGLWILFFPIWLLNAIVEPNRWVWGGRVGNFLMGSRAQVCRAALTSARARLFVWLEQVQRGSYVESGLSENLLIFFFISLTILVGPILVVVWYISMLCEDVLNRVPVHAAISKVRGWIQTLGQNCRQRLIQLCLRCSTRAE